MRAPSAARGASDPSGPAGRVRPSRLPSPGRRYGLLSNCLSPPLSRPAAAARPHVGASGMPAGRGVGTSEGGGVLTRRGGGTTIGHSGRQLDYRPGFSRNLRGDQAGMVEDWNGQLPADDKVENELKGR